MKEVSVFSYKSNGAVAKIGWWHILLASFINSSYSNWTERTFNVSFNQMKKLVNPFLTCVSFATSKWCYSKNSSCLLSIGIKVNRTTISNKWPMSFMEIEFRDLMKPVFVYWPFQKQFVFFLRLKMTVVHVNRSLSLRVCFKNNLIVDRYIQSKSTSSACGSFLLLSVNR